MAHQKNWKMPAQVIRVIDGDTVVLKCDLGFRVTTTIKARLYGIDTPEIHGPNRPDGLDAKDYLEDLIQEWRIDVIRTTPGKSWLLIETHKNKSDSFGRWIVRLIGRDDTDLNRLLVKSGHAQPADFGRDKSIYWPDEPERNS